MKKLVLIALTALSLFAAKPVSQTPKADMPLPVCEPCGSEAWW
jgi:hypothetical protein